MNEPVTGTPEFMNEAVDKFARDLVNRRAHFKNTGRMANPDWMRKRYTDMWIKIKAYFDESIVGKERAELVRAIFFEMLEFNTLFLIEDNPNNASVIEEKIVNLGKKLDSNNKLLVSVLKLLQEAME